MVTGVSDYFQLIWPHMREDQLHCLGIIQVSGLHDMLKYSNRNFPRTVNPMKH